MHGLQVCDPEYPRSFKTALHGEPQQITGEASGDAMFVAVRKGCLRQAVVLRAGARGPVAECWGQARTIAEVAEGCDSVPPQEWSKG